MKNLKTVGRVGGKALLYFEVISTLALLIGLIVGNTVHPGAGLNINAASLDAKSVSTYTTQSSYQTTSDFLLHIIPITVVDAFAKGDILEVLFVAILFGFAPVSYTHLDVYKRQREPFGVCVQCHAVHARYPPWINHTAR